MKKINIYCIFDILILTACVFFILSKKDVRYLYGAGSFVIITIILVWLEMNKETQLTDTVVTNDSDSTVFFKPENDSEPKEIRPHTTAEGVDGINVCGEVYKLCSGTHVIVDKNNQVKTKSLSGKFANNFRGGKISSPKDVGWEPLFNA